jgi:integrase
MDVAVSCDIVKRNVFQYAKMPNVPKKVHRALTEKERILVMSTYAGHKMGIPALFLLLFGIRRGELLALTWNDVDIGKMKITVNKAVKFKKNQPRLGPPKTKAGYRDIPIPAFIVKVMKSAKSAAKSIYVCPDTAGKLMTESVYKCAWKSYQNYLNIKAGGSSGTRLHPGVIMISNLTAHMFRHTYATFLYNAGLKIENASALLGHENTKITLDIYIHLELMKINEAIDNLNNYLNNKGY